MFTESKTIELKREYVDDIKKTVVAFANSESMESYEAARSLNQQFTFTWTFDFFKKRGPHAASAVDFHMWACA